MPNEIYCLVNIDKGEVGDFEDEEHPDLVSDRPSEWDLTRDDNTVIGANAANAKGAANRANAATASGANAANANTANANTANANAVNANANEANANVAPLKEYTEEETKKITSKVEIIRLLTERHIAFDPAYSIAHLR